MQLALFATHSSFVTLSGRIGNQVGQGAKPAYCFFSGSVRRKTRLLFIFRFMQGADLVGREVLGASVGLLGLALRQVAACLAIAFVLQS